MYDIIIIGGGVIGCAIARELSRYEAKICLLEKESDLCEGTSKANSAIVHGGFDAKPGSLKAELNVRGNAMMEELSQKLDIPFRRNGSLVTCLDEAGVAGLEKLLDQGKKNDVPNLRILSREEALALEPNLSDAVYAALYVPTGGIVCPFHMTLAFGENAAENGVEFRLQTKVLEIQKAAAPERGYVLQTNQGTLFARYVINAAGLYADELHNQVSEKKLHITPRKGDYCLLDKTSGSHVDHTIFQLPTKMGKGVLVTPTVHGNLLVGPTATDVEDKDATNTTASELQELVKKSSLAVKNVPMRQVITSFSGLRAHEDGNDFVIGEAEDAPGFFDVAGIASPGLSAAPAIGEYVGDLLLGKEAFPKKAVFKETRCGIPNFAHATAKERQGLIERDPSFGKIICRCETVTEGEILAAIHRPLGATTLDGVKRRTRAGMGRCQAGFCSPKVMEILARELGCPQEEICKNRPGSELLVRDASE